MDFFAAQDRARAASRRLVWWFILCVLAVVAVIYAVLIISRPFWSDGLGSGFDDASWWDPTLAAVVGPCIGGIIILGSIYKLHELSGGGAVVARSLGGRPVSRSTAEPLERRLVNVVDEMAIASGLPSPEIWLLEQEEGINAFAAGTDPGNAVIGVTSGCLHRLSRDELQGVVAHEFSHILNGDMRLNQRLAGWVFGLVMVSLVGRFMTELVRGQRYGARSQKGGDPRAAIALAGILLWLVGSVGVLLGRLLQAGISRQREFLADAAAVQFTRNPAGLAGALKVIGGTEERSMLSAPAAMEVRHLFFAESGGFLRGFMRTHPPLEQRIRALEPGWDGKLKRSAPIPGIPQVRRNRSTNLVTEPVFILNPGNSSHLHSEVGDSILTALSKKGLRLDSKESARFLILALLLLNQGPGGPGLPRMEGDESFRAAVQTWRDRLHAASSVERMALIDLALPHLRTMGPSEARRFIDLTTKVIRSDGQINLFEFMLQKVVERQIEIGIGLRRPSMVRYRGLKDVVDEVVQVLNVFDSVMANGAQWPREVVEEFRQHTGKEMPVKSTITGFDPPALGETLQRLDALPQLAKVQFLRLCGLVVMADRKVDDQEMELLRATAEAVGAPVPPFVRVI